MEAERSLNPFNRLPRELASRILLQAAAGSAKVRRQPAGGSAKALLQLGTVCKQFGELIKDVESISWEFSPGDCLAEAGALQFLRSAQRVTDLDLAWGPSPLQSRECEGPPPCISFLMGALVLLPKLRELKVRVNRDVNEGLFRWRSAAEHLIAFIPRLCPDLEVLSLSGFEQAKLDRALSPGKTFLSLKHVDISYCEVSGAFLESLVDSCPLLEDLHLYVTSGFTSLQIKSASLRELTIDETGECSDEIVESFVVDAPELVDLAADIFPTTTIINAPKLSFLLLGSCLGRVSRGKVVSLSRPWVLERLDCYGYWDIAHLSSVLLACKGIDLLDLTSTYVSNDNDDDVAGFLKGLGCAQELRIDAWRFFNASWDSDLGSYWQRFPLTRLKELSISINEDFVFPDDEETCKSFVALSPNLKQLKLIYDHDIFCPGPSDAFKEMLGCFKNAIERQWPEISVQYISPFQ